MESGRSLIDLVALGQDLEDVLHRKVDVLTESGVHPAIRPHVLADARPL
jgi:predicted nucleotidyltransferase